MAQLVQPAGHAISVILTTSPVHVAACTLAGADSASATPRQSTMARHDGALAAMGGAATLAAVETRWRLRRGSSGRGLAARFDKLMARAPRDAAIGIVSVGKRKRSNALFRSSHDQPWARAPPSRWLAWAADGAKRARRGAGGAVCHRPLRQLVAVRCEARFRGAFGGVAVTPEPMIDWGGGYPRFKN